MPVKAQQTPVRVTAEHLGYLRAGQTAGRIAARADADMIAFTLTGAVHDLFFTTEGSKPNPDRVRGIVTTRIAGADEQ